MSRAGTGRAGCRAVAGILSKDYGRQRAGLIDPEHAASEVLAGEPVGESVLSIPSLPG